MDWLSKIEITEKQTCKTEPQTERLKNKMREHGHTEITKKEWINWRAWLKEIMNKNMIYELTHWWSLKLIQFSKNWDNSENTWYNWRNKTRQIF
jgi:hypothetical protein